MVVQLRLSGVESIRAGDIKGKINAACSWEGGKSDRGKGKGERVCKRGDLILLVPTFVSYYYTVLPPVQPPSSSILLPYLGEVCGCLGRRSKSNGQAALLEGEEEGKGEEEEKIPLQLLV